MYTEVAAHHGVRGAAAALAAAYHGNSEWAQVVGAGAIQEGDEEDGAPTPKAARREGLAAALHWYDTALEPVTLGADIEEEASTLPGTLALIFRHFHCCVNFTAVSIPQLCQFHRLCPVCLVSH